MRKTNKRGAMAVDAARMRACLRIMRLSLQRVGTHG